MDRWHYFMVLGACLAVTAPLEMFGRGVYRQPRRTVAAIVPVAAVFLLWDVIAVAADVWWFNPRYLLGVILPGGLPLEEVLFFVVIPLCGLLTYSAVSALTSRRANVHPRANPSPRNARECTLADDDPEVRRR